MISGNSAPEQPIKATRGLLDNNSSRPSHTQQLHSQSRDTVSALPVTVSSTEPSSVSLTAPVVGAARNITTEKFQHFTDGTANYRPANLVSQ